MLVRVCAEEELSAEDKSVYTVLVQNAEATPLDVGYQWLSSRLRQIITLPIDILGEIKMILRRSL